MACTQSLEGILKDCEASMGGIVMAYIANHGDIADITSAEDGTITAIAMNGETKFKRYYTRRGASSMTSTLNADPATGVNYVSTEVVLTFPKMSQGNREEIAKLAVGQLTMIVKDANGKYWLLGQGEDFSVMASAGTGQTGSAAGDANNFTITLREEAPSFPVEVDAKIMESLVEPIVD